jgi:hypothetical protein
MRMLPRLLLGSFALLVVIGGGAGCNDPGTDTNEAAFKPAALPPDMTEYPKGPYDLGQGATVRDQSFPGFANALADSAQIQTLSFADFFNPHVLDETYQPAGPEVDDRLFPPGSPYGAGKPKPRALLLDIASVWCGPCNEEAKDLLPAKHARYAPCGGEFFFQLADGPQPGTKVEEKHLRTWTKVYKVDYPATYDQEHLLSALYSAGTFPDAAVIDTRTMQMITVLQGVPNDALWSTFESLLDPACLAKQ